MLMLDGVTHISDTKYGWRNRKSSFPRAHTALLSPVPIPLFPRLVPTVSGLWLSISLTADQGPLCTGVTRYCSSQLFSINKRTKRSPCLLPTHGLPLRSPIFSLNPAWLVLDAFPLLAALLVALSPEPWAQGSSLTLLSFTVTGLPQVCCDSVSPVFPLLHS